MSWRDVFAFASSSFRGHRLRTVLSLVGMAIGVAAVVVLTALGEGARRYVTEQFASLGTNLVAVIPGRTETTGAMPGVIGVPNDLTLDDAHAIERQVPGLAMVAPLTINTETVAHGERRRQVAILGSTADLLDIYTLSMAQGEFLAAAEGARGSAVVVLGWNTAKELFPQGDAVGKVVRIGSWRMRVIGVVAPRGTLLALDLDEIAVVPVGTAMRLFDRTSLFRILAQTRSHAAIPAARQAVLAVLAERHGEEDFTLITPDSVLSTLSQILTVLTLALGGIAAVSLTVAGVGIMNVMLVSVSERTGEVGLLKALGAHPRQILGVFLTEAALLSSAGGLVGLGLGVVVVRLVVRFYPVLPAAPPAWAVVAALTVSVGVGLTFGVLPARAAARLDPVEALAKA